MATRTKKLGSAGRYGARYGGLARKQVATIERVQRAKHTCSRCGAQAVRRISTGIWECKKCEHQFAGGAYTPQTGAGRGAQKALRGINDKLLRGETEEVASFSEAVAEIEEAEAPEAPAETVEDADEA